MNEHLLSLTIWIPILGALLVTVSPKSATKALSILASFAAMIASIIVALRYQPQGAKFQLTEQTLWIEFGTPSGGVKHGIEYFLGVDGISVTMVLLTGILSFICILASWGFEHWHTNKGIK
ncbi:MAG TPA: hypothetical protein VKW04_23375, partial [Planctomycetota bacterium]|nr:hypothetical protein [Planctomycetota bacterium]